MVESWRIPGTSFLTIRKCQAFRHGGFADTGLTHVQGIVLAAPAQYLHGAPDFFFTPDQRVDLIVTGALVEVGSELLQCAGFLLCTSPLQLPAQNLHHRLAVHLQLC